MAQKLIPAIRGPQKVDPQGRIVIPAEFRQELGLEPGVAVSFEVEDGVLKVMTLRRAVARVQQGVRERLGDTTGHVDDFIAERRAEASRE